jgi:23S rRNA (uracil1939-C5)-methyltransferase
MRKYSIDEIITITITSLGSSGEGVGSHEGFKIFVEGALIDEEVEVCLTTVKKNYAKARLLSTKKVSPHRVKPICSHAEECGGCQIMHLSYEQQLVTKRQRVLDAFQRIGNITDVEIPACISSPTPYNYRNKIQLPFTLDDAGLLSVGLYRRNTHDIIPVDNCHLHCPNGEAVLKAILPILQSSPYLPYDPETKKGLLRHLLIKSGVSSGESLVLFVTSRRAPRAFKDLAEAIMKACPSVQGVVENINTRHDNVIIGSTFHTLAGTPHLHEVVLGTTFKISPSSFFQVNTLQAEKLYSYAIKQAGLSDDDTVIDAYCGVGALSLLAAPHAKDVIGIECVSDAIKNAEENAALNNVTNASFLCGTTEKILPTLKNTDVIFLNPPRKGCDTTVLSALKKYRPRTIVYISCNPATLARDVALLQSHGFSLGEVQSFDMFPQTMHVETVATLHDTEKTL